MLFLMAFLGPAINIHSEDICNDAQFLQLDSDMPDDAQMLELMNRGSNNDSDYDEYDKICDTMKAKKPPWYKEWLRVYGGMLFAKMIVFKEFVGRQYGSLKNWVTASYNKKNDKADQSEAETIKSSENKSAAS